ncbi:MAG: hypothetical protein U1F68_13680 [Gammaproteobacteria bacterium]
MAWNKIAIYQDDKELKLVLVKTGDMGGPGTDIGKWWMCGPNKGVDTYLRIHAPEDLLWTYIGGVLDIGGWERSGYAGNDSERIYKSHVILWPSKRDSRGKLSVASTSGDGNGRLSAGPGTSGFVMSNPVTWVAMEFGIGSITGSC